MHHDPKVQLQTLQRELEKAETEEEFKEKVKMFTNILGLY